MNEKHENKFVMFAEKTNATALFFIIVLCAIVVGIIATLLFANREYFYLPEYESVSYSEDINPSFLVLSNYTESDEKIVQTNRLIANISKNKNTKDYSVKNIKMNVIGVTEDDFEYISEYNTESEISTYTTHTFTSLKSTSKLIYNKLVVKAAYDFVKDGKTERKVQTFSQDLFTLTKSEIDKIEKDEITEAKNVVSTYSISVKEETSSELKRVTAKLVLNTTELEKYQLSYQLFGVTESGKIETLVGYYNISRENNVSSYNRSITMPIKYGYDLLVGKLTYTDKEGNLHTLYSKQNFLG